MHAIENFKMVYNYSPNVFMTCCFMIHIVAFIVNQLVYEEGGWSYF